MSGFTHYIFTNFLPYFQCFHCTYYHWQKRTAEKHVIDEHPAFKIHVRDVRSEFEQLKKTKAADAKKKKEDKKTPSGGGQALPEVISYLPYKCGKEYWILGFSATYLIKID